MNRLESFVHNGLKQYPDLKDAIRTGYQAAMLPWIGRAHSCPWPTVSRAHHFFGFHDKTPWCPDNRRVLAHRSPGYRDPVEGPVEVGFFTDSSLTDFTTLGQTDAWSTQQGAQLQWCGGSGDVICNARNDNGLPCAILFRADAKERTTFDYPIGAVDAAGHLGCVVEFGAFGIGMMGYGYGEWAAAAYERRRSDLNATGLSEIDLRAGTVESRAPLGKIATLAGWPLDGSWHSFISHAQYSPDGSRLAFFFRRTRPGLRVQTKMCVYDRASNSIAVMESGDWVSHYCWLDENRLLVYLETEEAERGFYLLSAVDGSARAAEGLPVMDGHPNFAPASGLLVVDSYANRRRRQRLSVYGFDGGIRFTLVETMGFYSPLRFRNERRVDLHPRWDRRGERICIDSSFSGQASLTILNRA